MILSAQSIRARHGMVEPFCDRTRSHGLTFGLGPAGYDVRVHENINLSPETTFMLASTIERFVMPNDVLAVVHDKSTWARLGLAIQNTVIEPGWQGYLTLELSLHTKEFLHIGAGSPIAQIIFHLVDQPTEQPYAGKYQNQPAGAQPAKLEPVESDAPDQTQRRDDAANEESDFVEQD